MDYPSLPPPDLGVHDLLFEALDYLADVQNLAIAYQREAGARNHLEAVHIPRSVGRLNNASVIGQISIPLSYLL